ncbi:uncharacterized protein LOC144660160 [Oculina patagonica]
MSLRTFLHRLHEEYCKFTIPSSEVSDIESSVYEALSAILQKGQTLKVVAEDTADEEDEVETYGELFSVEEILPVGSFFEKTKIAVPDEFDFNIKLQVGEIDIHLGCRPGRVGVTFESRRQKRLESLGRLFSTMIDEALKTMSCDEKTIRRDSGTLHCTSNRGYSQAKLEFKWKGPNSEFDINVDVMPAIPCTNVFIADLGKNEHFPSNFHQLVKDRPCYLVPKPCSPNCQKCFHVSFAQAELYLMQSLDEGHRYSYRLLKWLLAYRIFHSYQLKMAVLDHVYNLKCQSTEKECIDEQCVFDVLKALLNNYNELRMPTFFLNNCCVITKDGEGAPFYLDYLVIAADIDVLTLPVGPIEEDGYKNYDWLDMFAWYEFQRRCLSLMIGVLQFISQVGIKRGLRYGCMLAVIKVLITGKTETGDVSIAQYSMIGRPTMREWRDNVPNFSQRVFIPAFSMILEVIQVVLKVNFAVPSIWFTSPIQLCLPCPVMGYSQGSIGSGVQRIGDLAIRQGVMCYFAQLKGSSWCPVAFGKMTFIENFDQYYSAYMSNRMSLYQGGPTAQLVKGSSLSQCPDANDDSEDEIPDFEGPFHYNARYDGEAFQENIVSCWYYKRHVIHLLLCSMAGAILLRSMFAR